MISGSPISSTPISAGLAGGVVSGNQTINPVGDTAFTWVAPSATLLNPQSLTPSAPAILTWTCPDATLLQQGTVNAPLALATWVAPSTTLTATGTATLVPDAPAIFTWVVRRRRLSGGETSSGGGSRWVGLPFNRFTDVVLSDTVNLPEMCLALYVGEGGDVVVVEENGQVRTFVGVPAGSILAVKAKRVNNTDTSAASIVALYRD